MGTRGRNGIIVAGLAALCVVVTMGIVDHSDRHAQAAAPAQGWRPADGTALHPPARRAVEVAPAQAAGSAGSAGSERTRGG